jgi:hypothetical protein
MTVKVYRIESAALAAVKKVLEEQEHFEEKEGKKEWVQNEWARNGYITRDARSLGIEGTQSYLYVSADDAFFKKHEKKILVEGVKESKDKEYSDVKNKVEEEQSSAACGVGAVFGDF